MIKNLWDYLRRLSWGNILGKLIFRLKNPVFFVDLFRFFIVGKDLMTFCMTVTGAEGSVVKAALYEAESRVISKTDYHKSLFILTRITKPEVFIETGVSKGMSSQAILAAMDLNRKGRLFSIDLPMEKCDDGTNYDVKMETGHNVPKNLRGRWDLILGDSKLELPKLMAQVGSIDIFLHDSLHTYDVMNFEYKTAWDYIKTGGLLLSHDIQWTHAFKLHSEGREYYVLGYNVGAIRRT
jgi:predicted O-methyltransferase YrrM